jgi:hypothetical protein
MTTIRTKDIVDVFCKKNKFIFTGKVHDLTDKTAHIKKGRDNYILPLTSLKKVFNDKAGH